MGGGWEANEDCNGVTAGSNTLQIRLWGDCVRQVVTPNGDTLVDRLELDLPHGTHTLITGREPGGTERAHYSGHHDSATDGTRRSALRCPHAGARRNPALLFFRVSFRIFVAVAWFERGGRCCHRDLQQHQEKGGRAGRLKCAPCCVSMFAPLFLLVC